MRKLILIGLVLLLVGCVEQPRTTSEPRFETLSATWLGEDKGYITIIKDKITGHCMASHLYQGVMSWRVPCDQQEYDLYRMQQMMQQGEVLQVPSGSSNAFNGGQ